MIGRVVGLQFGFQGIQLLFGATGIEPDEREPAPAGSRELGRLAVGSGDAVDVVERRVGNAERRQQPVVRREQFLAQRWESMGVSIGSRGCYLHASVTVLGRLDDDASHLVTDAVDGLEDRLHDRRELVALLAHPLDEQPRLPALARVDEQNPRFRHGERADDGLLEFHHAAVRAHRVVDAGRRRVEHPLALQRPPVYRLRIRFERPGRADQMPEEVERAGRRHGEGGRAAETGADGDF